MKRSIKVIPKKGRGRPATGKDPQVVVRMPPTLIAAVDAWGETNGTARSEAIRRLVEIGLGNVPAPATRVDAATRKDRTSRAKELASDAIDAAGDPRATSEERANRKGTLMKGPEEFRKVRRDRPPK